MTLIIANLRRIIQHQLSRAVPHISISQCDQNSTLKGQVQIYEGHDKVIFHIILVKHINSYMLYNYHICMVVKLQYVYTCFGGLF